MPLRGSRCHPEGRDAIQRDLDRLEQRACANFVKFNKVLHSCQGHPKYKQNL